MKLQVSVSEPESGYTASRIKFSQKVLLYAKKIVFFLGIRTEMPRLLVVILESESDSESMFRIS